MTDTVTTTQFSDPRGSLALAVRNADGTSTGRVMTPGSATAQRGIGKTGPNALHAGDNIKVKFLPAKDGSSLGFFKTVIMPDGREVRISAGKAND